MAKLILSMDGLVLKEIVLDKECISIGRKPNNDIQIDNLAISGQHALITTILGDSFLEDQNSTNGTYVNGQPVKKCVLHNNDVIELGKYHIKFIAEPARRGAGGGYVETSAAMRGTAAAPPPPPAADAPRMAETTQVLPPDIVASASAEASFDPSQLAVINVLSGPNAGRRLQLTKALTTLGRPGKQVAVITRRPHGYFVTHIEGASLPLVNGTAIDTRPHLLKDGDVLDIAGVRMAFSLSA